MKLITTEKLNLFREFLINEEKSISTISKYIHDLEEFAHWLDYSEFDKSSVLAYKNHLIEIYAPSSVNTVLSSLNSFFNFMEWYDLHVKNLKIQKQIFASNERELTKAEYDRLLRVAKDSGNVVTKGETIPATGNHVDADGKWETDADNHYHTCSCGHKFDTDAHKGGKATCVAKAKCEVCGSEYGDVKSDSHTLVKTEKKDATHETDGNIEYYTCSGCDKVFSDSEGKTAIDKADTVVSKGTHTYSDKKDAENHWMECECGSVIEKFAHTFGDWVITKEAAEGVEGSREKTCSACGHKVVEAIPAKSPDTSDVTVILLMLVSIVTLGAYVTVASKKKVR